MLLASDFPTLSWPELLLRLVLAAAFGGLIGLERGAAGARSGVPDAYPGLGRLGAVHHRLCVRVP
jgi:hypothetical protein